MDRSNLSNNTHSNKDLMKFLIPSLIGVFLFIMPIPYGKIINIDGLSSINIGIGFIAELIKIIASKYLVDISLVVVVSSAILSIISKFINIKNDFLRSILNVSPMWLIFRVLGALFIIMTVSKVGSPMVYAENTGEVVLGLLPSLLAIFLVSGFFLPLIVDFGLMDLLGTILSKFMYKLFKVPGRSAIDTISSWLGDGTLGIMITNTQYKQGYYTAKEACIISTCFSLVSLPFSTVIADQLGFMPIFIPFYATVCIASLICALIMPRIYPLNKISDDTYNNVEHLKEELIPNNTNTFKFALEKAISRAQTAPSFKTIIKNGFKTVVDMYLVLLPLVMAWGTISLIIAEFTPFFHIISYPIVFILKLLNIPDATIAAPAILVGFADMFLPSIMISSGNVNIMTQFIVGVLSIVQIIYLTETGAVLLKSDIPLNLKDLFLIFCIRTLIALPVITLIANIIF